MSTIDIIVLVVAALGILVIIGLGRASPREADEINREINRELGRRDKNDDA